MYKIYSKNKKIEISRIYLTRMLSVQDFTYNPLNFQYIYKKVVIIVYNTPHVYNLVDSRPLSSSVSSSTRTRSSSPDFRSSSPVC